VSRRERRQKQRKTGLRVGFWILKDGVPDTSVPSLELAKEFISGLTREITGESGVAKLNEAGKEFFARHGLEFKIDPKALN